MKKILISSAVGLMAAAQGATITWGEATNITGAGDVSLQGTYFSSWAPYHGDANNFPVDGVNFQGFSELGFDHNLWFGGQFFQTITTPDTNYNTLLSYGAAGGADNHTFSWGGMTPGHEYLIQFWVADPRDLSGGGDARQQTLSGSDHDISPTLSFPANGTGIGQYIIGTFIADASGTQTITIDPSTTSDPNDGSAQINLVQIRLIAVPEPSSLGLAGLGLLGAAFHRRRTQ